MIVPQSSVSLAANVLSLCDVVRFGNTYFLIKKVLMRNENLMINQISQSLKTTVGESVFNFNLLL